MLSIPRESMWTNKPLQAQRQCGITKNKISKSLINDLQTLSHFWCFAVLCLRQQRINFCNFVMVKQQMSIRRHSLWRLFERASEITYLWYRTTTKAISKNREFKDKCFIIAWHCWVDNESDIFVFLDESIESIDLSIWLITISENLSPKAEHKSLLYSIQTRHDQTFTDCRGSDSGLSIPKAHLCLRSRRCVAPFQLKNRT